MGWGKKRESRVVGFVPVRFCMTGVRELECRHCAKCASVGMAKEPWPVSS